MCHSITMTELHNTELNGNMPDAQDALVELTRTDPATINTAHSLRVALFGVSQAFKTLIREKGTDQQISTASGKGLAVRSLSQFYRRGRGPIQVLRAYNLSVLGVALALNEVSGNKGFEASDEATIRVVIVPTDARLATFDVTVDPTANLRSTYNPGLVAANNSPNPHRNFFEDLQGLTARVLDFTKTTV